MDADGPDNIVGTVDDDLRLQSTSPCLEIGANHLVPADSLDADGDSDLTEPTTDLALVQRILHALAAGGAAPCASAAVDMGAREFQADCNSNSLFDYQEILQNPALDANGNGIRSQHDSNAALADSIRENRSIGKSLAGACGWDQRTRKGNCFQNP